MRQLREFRGEVPELSGTVLTEAERSFVTTLRREGTARPRRSRRPLLAVAGLATAAAGVAVAVLLTSTTPVTTRPPVAGGQPSVGASSPAVRLKPVSVAEVLDLAAAAPVVTPGPGQFVVTESIVQDQAFAGDDGRYLYRVKRTTWISADNTKPGAIRAENLEPLPFPGRPVPAGVPAAGTVNTNVLCPAKGGEIRQDYAFYGTLPADAQGMLTYFRKFPGGGADKNYYLWKAGTELAAAAMPAAQHTAVFQALKLVPGAQLVGDTKDAAGRDGIAVGYVSTTQGLRFELIFDSATFGYLGSRAVVVDAATAGAPAGTQLAATAQLSVTVTDETPPAALGPKQQPCA
ncbi:CU044_5270 family protein [Dactylosporangium sp. NPDC049525]|uniref:CU044_5270 family protein n=1 Tax=Dactylosporangium sp. NPDC049525 TaxID=3154730 RepID=UPI00344041D9